MGMYTQYEFEFLPWSSNIIKHEIVQKYAGDSSYDFESKRSVSDEDLVALSLAFPETKIVLKGIYEVVDIHGNGLTIAIAKNGVVKNYFAKATYEGKSPEELINSFE